MQVHGIECDVRPFDANSTAMLSAMSTLRRFARKAQSGADVGPYDLLDLWDACEVLVGPEAFAASKERYSDAREVLSFVIDALAAFRAESETAKN